MTETFEMGFLWHKKVADDWRHWPPQHRAGCALAFDYQLKKFPPGTKVVSDVSTCKPLRDDAHSADYRRLRDLSDTPWELRRTVTVETPL